MALKQALTSFLMRLDFLCASFFPVVLFAISIELRSRRREKKSILYFIKQTSGDDDHHHHRRGEKISKNSL